MERGESVRLRPTFLGLKTLIKGISAEKIPVVKAYSINYLANCFLQILSVIFTPKPTGIVALNILRRIPNFYEVKDLFDKVYKYISKIKKRCVARFGNIFTI